MGCGLTELLELCEPTLSARLTLSIASLWLSRPRSTRLVPDDQTVQWAAVLGPTSDGAADQPARGYAFFLHTRVSLKM